MTDTTTHPGADIEADALTRLRAELTGTLHQPGDPGYDEARQGSFVPSDARPALIVGPGSAADVAAAVRFARTQGLELAVRSGGHSGAGHSMTDGLLLDVKRLDAVEVDAATGTVWAGSGLTAAGLSRALEPHGLVVGFGDTGSVGIGGITLGGGVGFFVRAHGLTIDNLLAAELVTADGELIVADAEHHPDLFWAIRGGGGNFGVATRFRYQAHAVPQVTGGMLVLPATPETVQGFMEASTAAPESVSAIMNVMPAPPMPFLAPEDHGRLIILGLVVCAEVGEGADAALAPFRALATPLADLVRPIPYAEMFPPEAHGGEGGPVGMSRTFFMDRVDAVTAERIVAAVTEKQAAGDVLMAAVQLRALGGATGRVPADATAYAHRDRAIMGNVAAIAMGMDAARAQLPWVEALAAELSGGDRAAYVNFLGDEGPDRVRDAYPGGTWDRLVDVKRRYDPDNVFHRAQNIPPAG
jgi:FAD/FMN-containing dehydrogenase